MKRVITHLLAVCICATALASCSVNEPDVAAAPAAEDITVVFIPKLTGNAFFEAANEGAQRYAQEHGFTVEYRGSPTASVDDQIAIVRDAIERSVDAICISSLDATALDNVLKEAIKAGIQVTTWDSDVSGDARAIMVSQGTAEQLGQMLVEMGAKSLSSRGINPTDGEVRYVWHYSQSSVADQNSWWTAGEKYINEAYPKWVNVNKDNYYSEQNAEKALAVGKAILSDNEGIDLIICNDSTALPGQAQAAQEMGLTSADVTITGFAPPNNMRQYCKDGIIERWGLWDCQVQGALGCYLAYYLASGNSISVGRKINVPQIGLVELMPNTVLNPRAYTDDASCVVLLPARLEFTKDNVDNYDF